MKLHLLFFSCIFYTSLTFSQPANIQSFKIVRLAAKKAFSLDQLNKEITTATTKEQVKAILWQKSGLQEAEIHIRINSNGKSAWWILNKSKNIDRVGEWMLTQSKGLEPPQIYSTDVLKGIIKDTLAILDTLKLNLFLQDEDLAIDKYYIMAKCKKTSFTQALAYFQHSIFITRPQNLLCNSDYIQMNLHNENEPQLYLGECKVYFMTDEDKATIKDLAINLKETDNKLALKDLVNYMSGFIERNYGKVSRYQLTKFLTAIKELKM